MMSTDWEKTTESEDMQITWVQMFEGLYGINEGLRHRVQLRKSHGKPKIQLLTSMIDKIEAVNDKTVRFDLKYPYSPIAHTFFSIKISSEREVTEAGDSFGTGPHTAGTGPYMITQFDMASSIKMKAYDGYWRGAPNIKNVEYVVISEDSAAVIAYENGEIDYLHDAPTAEWNVLAEAGRSQRCGFG